MENQKEARKAYSRMGICLTVFFACSLLAQIGFPYLVKAVAGKEVLKASWFVWVMMIVPMYVVAFPVYALISKKLTPGQEPEKHKMTTGAFLCCVLMDIGICITGAIIGAIINYFISGFSAGAVEESTTLAEMMIESKFFWRVFTAGILAPIVEELIFRKILLDRIHKFGEGMAILTSGLLFGLYHGNFSQFFFAAALGMFFAFIYLRTGRIGYTIGLHMAVNLMTSVVTVVLIQKLDLSRLERITMMNPYSPQYEAEIMEILPMLLLMTVWILFLFFCGIAGVVLWIVFRKKLFLKQQPMQLTEGKTVCWANLGMIAFFLVCVYRFLNQYGIL